MRRAAAALAQTCRCRAPLRHRGIPLLSQSTRARLPRDAGGSESEAAHALKPCRLSYQCHDLRLLPHVKAGDGPSDDHALNLARSFKYREADGDACSFRR
jgi:hypothetical protein